MCKIGNSVTELKGIIIQTLEHQISMRFKDPLESIEAAHTTMIRIGRRSMTRATEQLKTNFNQPQFK